MPCAPNPKFEKAVSDFTKILIENELIVEDFLFKEKKCKCIRVYYKRKIFYIIKVCDFTTADVLEDHQNWLNYLECIRRELCCFIRENTRCVPICINQTLLKSFQSTDGEIIYILRVDVKNESDKKIKNLVVRDLLLKKDMCVALLEVSIDHGCSVKPVDQDTPEQYTGNGYLLDPRTSCLEPGAKISIIYTMQLIDQTVIINNMVSRLEVYGRFVSCVSSEMILDPISRAGDIVRGDLSRNLLNTIVPPNCILVRPISFGINGVIISKVINGITYSIKLTNWVKKSGTFNQYIKVDYELLPADKGVISKILSLSLLSLYTTYPNNTSGTLTMPLNTILCGTFTYQTTFLAIQFCIEPCMVPTISLALAPINPVVAAGTKIPVATSVTGFPAPTITYAIDDIPTILTIDNEVDTTGLAPGLHTLVGTATNTCGSASSSPVTFEICTPPTVTLSEISPTLLARDVSPPYPYLTVDYTASGSPAPSITYNVYNAANVIVKTGPLTDDDTNTVGWQLDLSSLVLDGDYNFELVATNICGTIVSETKPFKIVTDTTPPAKPIINSVLDVFNNVLVPNNSNICINNNNSARSYIFNISAEPGSTVRLYRAIPLPLIQAAAGTADSNGNVNLGFTPSGGNAGISRTWFATATDSNGNVSAPSDTITLFTYPSIQGSVDVAITATRITDSEFDYLITLSNDTVTPSPYTLEYTIFDESNVARATDDITSGTATGTIGGASSETIYTVQVRATTTGSPCPSDVLVGTSAPFQVCLLPSVSISPASRRIFSGETAVFTANAFVTGGDTLTYQWYKNNVIIAGATLSTLTLTNVPISDNGSQYYVRVTSSCGATVNSEPVTLQVILDTIPPSAPTLTGFRTAPDRIYFSWSPPSTDNVGVVNYTLYRSDGITYNAGTFTSITITSSGSYNYYVRASDAAGNFTNSNAINIPA